MYFILILSLTITLHSIPIEATCNKTNFRTTTTLSSSTTAATSTSSSPINNLSSSTYENDDLLSRNANNQESTIGHQQGASISPRPSTTTTTSNRHTTTDSISLNELDDLRLEYNKYKIISHIGMTANPDQLAPDLGFDVRHRLALRTAIKDKHDSIKDGNNTSSRQKRSLACHQVKSNKDACCLETFYVNFTDIGWDKWIIYPGGYNANYCQGQCDLSHARYYHSTLLSKFSNVIGLCCSPKQMAPLRLLYVDEDNKVHQKSVPDMIVESCDCA